MMQMNITMDRPWSEQSEEVRNAIDERTYNEVARVLGFNIKHKKTFVEKLLTNISKCGIMRV